MEGSNIKYNSNANIKNNLKFILPSLLGIILFMIPIKYNDQITIPIAIFSNALVNFLGTSLIYIITFILVISAVMSTITSIFKPKFILENKFLKHYLVWDLYGLQQEYLVEYLVYLHFLVLDLNLLVEELTGAFVLNDLLTVLFSIFLFAGLLLPLLLNFGLLEFFGSLLTKVMRPIFKLPGRSSIDCITSWLGDGTLGILLTSKQYEEGFYTKREAATISTTFSAVSITFSLVVISQVGLSHMFIPFYLTVSFAGIVAAIIVPRIPPLSKRVIHIIMIMLKKT